MGGGGYGWVVLRVWGRGGGGVWLGGTEGLGPWGGMAG